MQQIKQEPQYTGVDRIVAAVGSVSSLVIHTIAFALAFLIALLGLASFETVLLVLTTLVSLEAIYLAIFIQITVNRHTKSLQEVEEDIEEIQEDVEELGEDMEDIQEDLEEISEDIDEIQEDVEEMTESEEKPAAKKAPRPLATDDETLARLSRDVARVLKDLEELKQVRSRRGDKTGG